jgi:hypothetical protein
MTKIKVPARIKQSQFDTLTNYFPMYDANNAKEIFGSNSARFVQTWDGTGYWVKYVFKDFHNCYLHFSKAKKNKHGDYIFG